VHWLACSTDMNMMKSYPSQNSLLLASINIVLLILIMAVFVVADLWEKSV
jgi:hypothetical protein